MIEKKGRQDSEEATESRNRNDVRLKSRLSCLLHTSSAGSSRLHSGDEAPPTDFSFDRCMQCDVEMLKSVEEGQPEKRGQIPISGFSPSIPCYG